MQDDSINIHDNYQFDIQLDYDLTLDSKETLSEIEAFLFLPNSLGLNRHTYRKEDFYEDIHSFVKLNLKPVELSQIVTGEQCPFIKLKKSIDSLNTTSSSTSKFQFEYQIKSFCCLFKESLKAAATNINDSKDINLSHLNEIQKILIKYRGLFSAKKSTIINQKLLIMYQLGDEFLSLTTENHACQLMELTKGLNGPTLKDEMLNIIRQEHEHRINKAYKSIPDADSDNEEFIFRKNALDNFINSMFFLDARVQPEGNYLKQVVFAIGAAIAMIFSTGVAFFATIKYAAISIEIFIVFIISYMFKDRIKELIRDYMWDKIKLHLFDHKIKISYDQHNLGWSRESVTFLTEDRVPADIMNNRNRDHLTELDSRRLGEQVILYKKQIQLYHKGLDQLHIDYRIDNVHDIIRFNIYKFLTRMSDPKKMVYVLQPDQVSKTEGKKVYYIDLALKHRVGNDVQIHIFRITLNRYGIKRIEKI
jgi:hypothetical protein